MINSKDQEQLFKLISNYIKKNIECVSIGGTAMIFLGYKQNTKDIDLIFKNTKDREVFIDAIKKLGYKQISMKGIYKNLDRKGKPLMFTRNDERFDLFVHDVFGCEIDFNSIVQKQDFIGEKELIMYVLPKEYLILLKAITNRDRDYEDIKTIIDIEKNVNWDFITEKALEQKDKWIILDLEETMQKLRKECFIPSKYFDKLYNAQF